MKDIVKNWIEFAEGDLLTAKDLLAGKSKRYESCIFFCHQALEKILKAKIIDNGVAPKKIHDLVALLDTAIIAMPKEMVIFLKKLNPHYMPTRYPDIAYEVKFHYTKKIAEDFYKNTKEAFSWIKKRF